MSSPLILATKYWCTSTSHNPSFFWDKNVQTMDVTSSVQTVPRTIETKLNSCSQLVFQAVFSKYTQMYIVYQTVCDVIYWHPGAFYYWFLKNDLSLDQHAFDSDDSGREGVGTQWPSQWSHKLPTEKTRLQRGGNSRAQNQRSLNIFLENYLALFLASTIYNLVCVNY